MTTEWFIILAIVGLCLIGAEVFVPGGVLGAIGALSLLGAIGVGFVVFPPHIATLLAVLIMLGAGVALFCWIRYFPKTRIGKYLTLDESAKSFKATDDRHALLHQQGVAKTDLRPSGIAEIGGKRVDVVGDGSWIEQGDKVEVIHVEGNTITVRAL